MSRAVVAESLRSLVAERPPGHTLARRFYVDEAVYQADLRAVFGRGWLFAGPVARIPRPGDYFVVNVKRFVCWYLDQLRRDLPEEVRP